MTMISFATKVAKLYGKIRKQGRIHDIRCVPILHYAIFRDFYKSITDQPTDQRTDGWMDGPMGGPTDGPTDGWTDGHTLL